ncbi:acyltransferase 3 [Cellulomonas flavigena DSM 20109]|uniref:Acyltransferase 3 n=1 Tax=Cellulomonas flavigena (strain ATCC 482 / DSM 20109 / BCRC 11376 / JCM 18109 / NBRC 3775 / NCIMB 8073 / NRS 134) TaxID=446466 RepID=D5UHK8_CELFN|nr:acyltransferase family protein [Cellulomonas flavigena]ADG75329.1 acyltransferase 3 [Cellulomonas flavigena DSM 20109]
MSTSATIPGTATRSVGIDLVRVVAVVAIVLGHVWSEGPFRTVVHLWHVPVFFLLSGYLWRSGRPLGDEVRRRARTLLVPYVAWLVIILAVVVVIALARGEGLPLGAARSALLGGAYATRPFSAFWFVTALFVAVVLYRVLDRGPWWVRWVGALIGLTLGYVAGDVLTRVPLSIGLALPCLVFVAAGHELARWRPRLPERATVPVGLGLVAVGAVAVATGLAGLVDLKRADLGTPVVSVVVAVLVSTGLVLLAEAAARHVPEAAGRTVVALAATALLVVLTHAVVLWLLGTPPQGRALDAALALVLPWALGLALLRVPAAAPVLLGGAAARPARAPVG